MCPTTAASGNETHNYSSSSGASRRWGTPQLTPSLIALPYTPCRLRFVGLSCYPFSVFAPPLPLLWPFLLPQPRPGGPLWGPPPPPFPLSSLPSSPAPGTGTLLQMIQSGAACLSALDIPARGLTPLAGPPIVAPSPSCCTRLFLTYLVWAFVSFPADVVPDVAFALDCPGRPCICLLSPGALSFPGPVLAAAALSSPLCRPLLSNPWPPHSRMLQSWDSVCLPDAPVR